MSGFNKWQARIIIQSSNRVIHSNPIKKGKSKIVAGEITEKRSKPGNPEYITLTKEAKHSEQTTRKKTEKNTRTDKQIQGLGIFIFYRLTDQIPLSNTFYALLLFVLATSC